MSNLNLDRILVTADLHIGHNLLREMRGFDSIHQHDDSIVANWNAAVEACGPGKVTVYLLGDVGFRCAPGYLAGQVSRLKAHRIVLIRGNHDIGGPALKQKCRHLFSEVWESFVLKGAAEHPLACKGQVKVYMHHYAHLSWPRAAVHLFGHSHGKRRVELGTAQPGSLDVGVDCHQLRPITLRSALDQVFDQKESDHG